MTKIRSIQDLTDDLALNYEKLSNGTLSEKKARELSNMAATLIYSVNTALKYNMYMKNNKMVPFLESKRPLNIGEK